MERSQEVRALFFSANSGAYEEGSEFKETGHHAELARAPFRSTSTDRAAIALRNRRFLLALALKNV